MTPYGPKDIADSFRTVRKNTIQVAQDIPEDKYDYRAAEGMMSVREMLAHLATRHLLGRAAALRRAKRPVTMEDFGRYTADGKAAADHCGRRPTSSRRWDRAERPSPPAWRQMTEAQLAEHVSFPAPIKPSSKSRMEMLLSVKEHEMHHRGQLMLIERLLGIVPHLTTGSAEPLAEPR